MNIKKSYPSWPQFEQDECLAVQNVLRSGKVNYWTGEECRLFEQEFADYHGVKYAIALANGTLALELALRVLDIGPGDEVIVPARTFLATASAVIALGAMPICADVDLHSQTISVESIKTLINSKTKAIIVVHLAGWSCDMDPIVKLCQENNLKLIEDCAQSHGARYKNKKVGTFSDIAAFSFCQDKIMTTGGEGGMLIMNDSKLWERAWSYKDHGKNFEKTHECKKYSGFQYVHDQFGSNYRMTEMQAAIGRCQLRKLDQWIEQRRNNARVFIDILSRSSLLRIPMPSEDYFHAYYKFYVFLKLELLPTHYSRDRILRELSESGVPVYSGSCPEIYLEKAFRDRRLGPKERLLNAKTLGEESLMFAVHPTLSEEDIAMIAKSALASLEEALVKSVKG